VTEALTPTRGVFYPEMNSVSWIMGTPTKAGGVQALEYKRGTFGYSIAKGEGEINSNASIGTRVYSDKSVVLTDIAINGGKKTSIDSNNSNFESSPSTVKNN